MSLKSDNDKLIDYVVKSRVNILKMLKYRGYNTNKYDNFTNDELQIYFNENALNMLVEHEVKDESCLIYYLKSDKTKSTHFKQLIGVTNENKININGSLFDKKNYELELLKENTKTVIFIFIIEDLYFIKSLKDEDLPNSQKFINIYHNFYKKKNNIFLQLFEIKRFLFNIMDHKLVPKHQLLTEEEYNKEVVEKYKITSKNQLPIIKRYDPVARYIGLKPDDVCKITRRSDSVGTYIGFRICK